MGLNTHLTILEPSDWLPGMQFTDMCGPQQFTAHQFCTRTVSECFWLQLTGNLSKSCLSYGVFLLYVLLLPFSIIGSTEGRQLTQWFNNILKDPGSFCHSALPSSFRLLLALVLNLVLSQSSVVVPETHHLLTQLFHKAEGDAVPHS